MKKSIRVLAVIVSLSLTALASASSVDTSSFNGAYPSTTLSTGTNVNIIQNVMPKLFMEIGYKTINNINHKLKITDSFIERDGNKTYLIYVMDNMTEIVFEVIDKNRLVMLIGGAPTTYHKVNGSRLVKL